MRKVSTLVLLALMASPAFFASSTASTAAIPEEPEYVKVCYYGVTLTVSPKIAKRYVKIGATYGACGEQQGECPPGCTPIGDGLCRCPL